jgi:hypothetical protein
MPVRPKLPGYEWFRFQRNVKTRVGMYTGVSMSLVFAGWVFCANRMTSLERIAEERNVIAVLILLFLACLPILRFYREPGELLLSGLLGWSLLTVSYWFLCLKFSLLEDRDSPFQIFVMGAIVYLIVATLAWLGTIIRKARMTHTSHLHH